MSIEDIKDMYLALILSLVFQTKEAVGVSYAFSREVKTKP